MVKHLDSCLCLASPVPVFLSMSMKEDPGRQFLLTAKKVSMIWKETKLPPRMSHKAWLGDTARLALAQLVP